MATATKPRARSRAQHSPDPAPAPTEDNPAVEADREPSVLETIAEQAKANAERAQNTPTRPEVLVDLDEGAIDQPDVRFKGKTYKIRVLDDFGIRVQQRLTREGREFFQLWSSDDELTDDQGDRLEELLEHMFGEVFIAPQSVKKQLSDGQKAQIVLGFTLAPVAQRTRDLEAQQTALMDQADNT